MDKKEKIYRTNKLLIWVVSLALLIMGVLGDIIAVAIGAVELNKVIVEDTVSIVWIITVMVLNKKRKLLGWIKYLIAAMLTYLTIAITVQHASFNTVYMLFFSFFIISLYKDTILTILMAVTDIIIVLTFQNVLAQALGGPTADKGFAFILIFYVVFITIILALDNKGWRKSERTIEKNTSDILKSKERTQDILVTAPRSGVS